MNNIEQLERKVEATRIEMEARMDAMNAEIEALKASQDDEWPNNGDAYWFYAERLHRVAGATWRNDEYDKHRLASGNCHRTEEAAEAYRAWLTDPRTQARRMVEMWLSITNFKGSLEVFWWHLHTAYVVGQGLEPSYLFIEQTQSAIDKLGEDLIKVSLGVITGDQASDIVLQAMRRG